MHPSTTPQTLPPQALAAAAVLLSGTLLCASALAVNPPPLIAPLGESAHDWFGHSVSGAGDVNGDGHSDVIVGAPQIGAASYTAGSAYVYYGGPGADAAADLTLVGEVVGDRFGVAVAGAGDVNADGFADLIVGAHEYGAVGSVGRAYVFYGGPAADSVADLTLTGNSSGNFGWSVSGAGDFNGDGFDDVIVGARFETGHDRGAGRVYVYYGGPSVDAAPDLVLLGEEEGDHLGWSVSRAGDFNGDGHDDIIAGASRAGDTRGKAYVYYGGPAADAVADLAFIGEAGNDGLGRSVSGGGDVNGDGYADVVVGAAGSDAGGSFAGRAYVYYGGPTPDTTPDLTLTGEAANKRFGWSVSGAGDVNGDGYADVIVGTWDFGDDLADAGWAYAFYGGPGIDNVVDLALTGEAVADGFGQSVSIAGDVSGDGLDDVVVGAPRNDEADELAGKAYVYAIDVATPVLLWLFTAEPTEDGIEVRWQFGDPTVFSDVELLRSALVSGPWTPIVAERRQEHAVTVVLDRESPTNATYYRLRATDRQGQLHYFGPIEVVAALPIGSTRLSGISPNPTRGPARVDFSISEAGWVNVAVLDVNGREVLQLVDEHLGVGSYQAMWTGQGVREKLPAGVYFVQLVVGDTREARRVVVSR